MPTTADIDNAGRMDQALLKRIISDVMPCLACNALRRSKSSRIRPDLGGAFTDARRRLYRILIRLCASRRGIIFHDSSPAADEFEQIEELLGGESINVRTLGFIHENLTAYELCIAADGQPALVREKKARKSSGSFYTPEPIVRYIVENTLRPVLDAKLNQMRESLSTCATRAARGQWVERLFDLKILDPAMGSGHFLVAAVEFIAAEVLRCAPEFSNDPAFGFSDVLQLKREIATRCVYGVDTDPLATELCRASLWLETGGVGDPATFLGDHLKTAHALIDEAIAVAGDFDAVIGNPPYLGHRGDVDGPTLRRRFNVCADHANVAAAFIELALKYVRKDGVVGMIVPKSIQYVDAWEPARKLLALENRLEHLVDVSQAFGDVLLEQTIFIASRRLPREHYNAGTWTNGDAQSFQPLPCDLLNSLGCLPADLEQNSLPLLRKISKMGPSLGSISRTAQALGYQSKINRDITGRHRPVLRGRNIRALHIDTPTDWIDEHFLNVSDESRFTAKVERMLRPKIVTQNIIAHLTRPRTRIWIISAPDDTGLICLNTVSTTTMTDERFDHRYISLILNSSLACWFYYEFVFCRAVRTMHFDQYYAGKLPVAMPVNLSASSLANVMAEAQAQSSRVDKQRLIDAFVFDCYGLTADEREFVIDYCYGPRG